MAIKVEFGLYKVGSSTSIYSIDFQDASSYIREVSISRGKSNELDTYDAATANVKLSNQDRVFDPSYSSAFSDLVRPTGVVRISKDGFVLFTGLISDWNLSYEQSGDSVAEIQATDAFWLLSNLTIYKTDGTNLIPADSQTSTQRMQTILTRPEVNWSLTDTQFSVGKAVLGGGSSEFAISNGTSVLEYLQLIEKSEVGRLFVGKDGKLVFKTRTDDIFALNYSYQRINLSTNPSFENDTTGWTAAAGTLTKSTGTFYVGGSSGLLTSSGQADQYFNAISNATYTLSAYVKLATPSGNVTITGSQSLSGTSWEVLDSTTYTISDSNWYRISVQITLDTDYTNGKLSIAADSGSNIYIDAVLIEASPILSDYFDGTIKPSNAVVDGVTYTYTNAWNL
jgi:hypothetical protein